MLAIVRCLEEWDAELRSVESFQIRTDHKNLEYFMAVRKLTERQMRWSLILSRYNFTILYLPGKLNERADALSRREQDMPGDAADDRIQHRTTQMLRPEMLASPIQVAPVAVRDVPETPVVRGQDIFGEAPDLEQMWVDAEAKDGVYRELCCAVQEQRRSFPTMLGVRVSITECSQNGEGKLLFRGRRWVPDSEPLRTGLIQYTHDSTMAGHPGRDVTGGLLSRQFFWPGMLQDVRIFCRNCDKCRMNNSWKDRRQGFLKPLPVPERIWREISVDFVVDLPLSNDCKNLLVITDRLSKGVILEACNDMSAEWVAETFIRRFYRLHGLPTAIVSDRGTQFVGSLWKRVCQLLKVVRRVSTAYHPETDGATERINQNVEAYIRTFTNYDQSNWANLLPMAELAINNHDAASTGVSPFFLSHGYHMEPLQLFEELGPEQPGKSPVQKADQIVRRMKEATEWAQMAMAVAQEAQEETSNRKRQQSYDFKEGDKVWLNLKNVRTDRPCKKFDVKNAKYTILKKVSSHAFRLDTPPGIHNVFHSVMLRPAAEDPLPSQRTIDPQPPPHIVGRGRRV